MNFIAIILLILLWNQTRTTIYPVVISLIQRWLNVIERACNGGQYMHGVFAWLVGVLFPSVLVVLVYRLAYAIHPLIALFFTVAVLWQFLEVKSMMRQAELMAGALMSSNIVTARDVFVSWFSVDPIDSKRYSFSLLARRSIELGLLMAHRRLFAPLFWFVILGPFGFGPAPVVLFVFSAVAQYSWCSHGAFGGFAQTWFNKLNMLPTMATAFGVAMVGDFEDALFAWRTQSAHWQDRNEGVLLASFAGALGIKMGDAYPQGGVLTQRPELGIGEEPEGPHLLSAIGLIRRVFVLLVVILLMLTVAYWLGM